MKRLLKNNNKEIIIIILYVDFFLKIAKLQSEERNKSIIFLLFLYYSLLILSLFDFPNSPVKNSWGCMWCRIWALRARLSNFLTRRHIPIGFLSSFREKLAIALTVQGEMWEISIFFSFLFFPPRRKERWNEDQDKEMM